MKKQLLKLIIFSCCLFGAGMPQVYGQFQVFNMSDTLVSICQGRLLDSEEGQNGNYDHNENYTFTICPPGPVDSITLNFLSFCTEGTFDYLRIFNGTDTLGTLLAGPFSDTVLPPPIVSGGCITINFITDANVACTGWVADWKVYESIPIPPTLNINPSPPPCSTSTVTVNFGYPVNCDSITGSHFSINGILPQSITATPIGCSGGMASQAQVNFSPGLNAGGLYMLNYTSYYLDACDSLWELTTADTFFINDCPLFVLLEAVPDSICPGSCTNLVATVTGGDSTTYAYAWSNGLPATPGPHTVCPTVQTTYSVTVTDGSPAPPAIASTTVYMFPTPNAQANVTVCESNPPFNLTASPPGGYWQGAGIVDSIAGTFDPSDAGAGAHYVHYFGPNGCSDSTLVTVNGINAGPPQAACPGTPAFNMTGFSPPGGSWSGPNITPGGSFNPSTAGTYTVTYTVGGCSDTKTIYVQAITIPADTSYCSSAPRDTFNFSPPGGTWSGPGIVNSANGYFNPANANPGANTLTYTINGCSDNFTITITSINAGPNQTVCPKAPPFIISAPSPPGGIWSGPGLLNTTTGLFDPGTNNQNWNALLTYSVNGCTDEKFVYMRLTSVIADTLTFCRQDTLPTLLDYPLTGRNPGGGTWSGPGLVNTTQNAPFIPANAGPGIHTMTYLRGGCSDSLTINIPPPRVVNDTTLCEFEPPFQLRVNPEDHPAGGTWSGTGVTTTSGIFDPQVAGVGTWTVYYQGYDACLDSGTVTVTPPPTVTLSGLGSFYCYIDTVIPLVGSPVGGTLTGTGLSGLGFNPSLAGPGTHELTYTYGDGACQRSTSIFVSVGIPLGMSLTATDDTICLGEFVTLTAAGFGGQQAGFTYIWNLGLGSVPEHQIQPSQSGVYLVVVGDGCSDPVMDSIAIVVRQPFSVQFDTSNIQCFGNNGYAKAIPSIPGNFNFLWTGDQTFTGDSINVPVGETYTVRVQDEGSGCSISRSVTIPGYPFIRANFSGNPTECVPITNPTIDFLDLSNGALTGTWEFGDGMSEPYVSGIHPSHDYPGVGEYVVTLSIENIGMCTDTFSIEVCVDPVELSFYNSFSPNNDGVNDFFEIDGIEGYPQNSLRIFNRYGNLVYSASPYRNDWNGINSINGKPLPDGAYFYLLDRGNGSKETAGDVVIMR